MISLFAKKSLVLRHMRAFSTALPTLESIAKNVTPENEYTPLSGRPAFNYAGVCELLYDAHKRGLQPKGKGIMATFLGASLFGNYYYWYLLTPFNSLNFGLTCLSTFILCMMRLNGAMYSKMYVCEVIVLPSREHVRFVMMDGSAIECLISDVNQVKESKGTITLQTNRGGKLYNVLVNLTEVMAPEYINRELLVAIGHPDVHKI